MEWRLSLVSWITHKPSDTLDLTPHTANLLACIHPHTCAYAHTHTRLPTHTHIHTHMPPTDTCRLTQSRRLWKVLWVIWCRPPLCRSVLHTSAHASPCAHDYSTIGDTAHDLCTFCTHTHARAHTFPHKALTAFTPPLHASASILPPPSLSQQHARCTLFLDKPSASLLRWCAATIHSSITRRSRRIHFVLI